MDEEKKSFYFTFSETQKNEEKLVEIEALSEKEAKAIATKRFGPRWARCMDEEELEKTK